MTIQTYPSAISLSDIRYEFGGPASFRTLPVSLSTYYRGGSYVPASQVGYPPSGGSLIPASGPLSFSNFYGAWKDTHYVAVATANQTYQASTGWSIDHINGHLTATLATWSNVFHATPDASYLINATTASLTAYGGWNQVAQVQLDVPNTVYYGFNNTLIKLGGIFYDGQTVNAYANGGWCMAASWDGANSITIYCNPSLNGTGDTGSSITMSNLIYSFGTVSGGTTTTVVYYNGVSVDTFTPNTSYTFNFR